MCFYEDWKPLQTLPEIQYISNYRNVPKICLKTFKGNGKLEIEKALMKMQGPGAHYCNTKNWLLLGEKK